MLLYVHVPFCSRKCRYCAFASHVPESGELELYGRALIQEIAFWRERLGPREVETLFIGGGTPSLLPVPALAALYRALDRRFGLPKGIEATLEANPESVLAKGWLREVRRLGFNRLSLGAQSLNDEFLQMLGRPHSSGQVRFAVEGARMAGFQNLSLDLIWGLPGKPEPQRLSQWLSDLKLAVALRPDHLSCYGLTLEEGTELTWLVESGQLRMPEEQELARMYVYGAEYLEGEGLLQYEVSNFGRMGLWCEHNQGYWEGKEYLGLGPSAVSTVAGRRWTNPDDLAEWAARVESRRLGEDAEALTQGEQARELVMLSLRTTRGLRLKDYRALTGVSLLKKHERLIQALRQHELIRVRDGYLRLTRQGMLVSNTILERLFEGLD